MSDSSTRGLDAFASDLNPEIVGLIRSWQGDDELDRLYQSLQSNSTRRGFLDLFAEALVAAHVRQAGCSISLEVGTPSGRSCDLAVRRGDGELFIHVKRLAGKRRGERRLRVSSRLRILERIPRPWIVKIRWHEGIGDEGMQRLVHEAGMFIERARLGEEHVVRDDKGTELGGVRIVAPSDGPTVSLVIGLPDGFIDDTPRIHRLLHRARKQFMPKAANLILVCTEDASRVDEVEAALLGSHEERWDTHPPPGARVAVGRGDDGFWRDRHAAESQLGGWFWLAPMHRELQGRLWIRDRCDLDTSAVDLARELFDPTTMPE